MDLLTLNSSVKVLTCLPGKTLAGSANVVLKKIDLRFSDKTAGPVSNYRSLNYFDVVSVTVSHPSHCGETVNEFAHKIFCKLKSN